MLASRSSIEKITAPSAQRLSTPGASERDEELVHGLIGGLDPQRNDSAREASCLPGAARSHHSPRTQLLHVAYYLGRSVEKQHNRSASTWGSSRADVAVPEWVDCATRPLCTQHHTAHWQAEEHGKLRRRGTEQHVLAAALGPPSSSVVGVEDLAATPAS